MHYHCEIIMPPTDTDDVLEKVSKIMAPFNECEPDNPEEAEEWSARNGFWDYWLIGGRWSGIKAQSRIDPKRLEEFFEELQHRKVTVSGVQFGKQELSPSSQIPMVDSLWREWFPDAGFDACPLFKHAGDLLNDDICSFGRAPLDMKCERVIVAGPIFRDPTVFEAVYMVEDSIWNGVTHQKTVWDGTIRQAVEQHNERLASYSDEYREKFTIRPDWTVVTIDYHS